MPIDTEVKKVLVIGSGPIVIGQAAEFDYAGTQACLTLKAEGCEVILINNNPATIMTDENVADKVYFEPLTVENIEKIIQKEQPDGILATVSGQTGLNLAFKLEKEKIIEKYNLKILGTPIEAIKHGEDRDKFRSLMQKIEEPTPKSTIIDNLHDAISFSKEVGYPIIVRPAYTLGGSGGGIATGENELIEFVTKGLRASPINQCLIEESIAGWKEIEFEVVRDQENNAIIVCHMENIDPVGVHTGDSLVVAPIQTLSETEIKLLRNASLKIVSELGIVGACNVQLAFEPKTKQYIVIEVNPRVSRSSALASKATGFPIAKIATKLSLGYTLDELPYEKGTLADYEPTFDYVVVKFPCWPFNKLTSADRRLGTQMKSTGEVMAVEKTVAAAMQKAVRSLELKVDGLSLISLEKMTTAELKKLVIRVDDRRFFAILELLRRGIDAELISKATKIDPFFLNEMVKLVRLETKAKHATLESIPFEQFIALKKAGFSDSWLAKTWNTTVDKVKAKRYVCGIFPIYHAIQAYTESDTELAEYYYVTWMTEEEMKASGNSVLDKQLNRLANGRKDASIFETQINTDKNVSEQREKILIIGSGPIRIGQGIEFDYCSVQGIQTLQKFGYEAVLINNNPATVSTDYEMADKLYVEPITADDVLLVMEHENINKAIVQFGGQTAINLVKELEAAGVELLGSKMKTIDTLEDRDLFYQYLRQIDVPHIPGLTATSHQDLEDKANRIGFPILLRPSYVIGGTGMVIIRTSNELDKYIQNYLTEHSYPLLIDAYYPGKEVEVDAVTDGEQVFIPAIFEHIEKAGVHSGDSMAVTPPVSLSDEIKEQIIDYTEKIAKGIDFKGVFNIQFVIYNGKLYVLEVNPRASRTVPVISKVTGVNLIELATATLLGKKLSIDTKILPENEFYTVKAPIFSTNKLPGVDPKLVPEMKSTGELIAIGKTFSESLAKAFLWNEELAKKFSHQGKEIYIASTDARLKELEEAFRKIGLTVKYKEDFEAEGFKELDQWMKSDEAIAIFSTEENSVVRERAQEFQLIVMSAEETLRAFSKINPKNNQVTALQQLPLTFKKEVVLT